MFERIISELLSKYLGSYIHGLNNDSLNFGMWSGKLSLYNLQVKSSAIDSLDLPFSLSSGILGKLDITVPWRSIYTDPTIISFTDLFILLRPRKQDKKWNKEEYNKQQQKQKQKKLEKLEKNKQEQRLKSQNDNDNDDNNNSNESQGFSKNIMNAILKNLEIYIKNVHFRIEDPDHSFAVGLTINSAGFCNQNFIEKGFDDFLIELLSISDLGLYWNHSLTNIFKFKDNNTFKNIMRDYIYNQNILEKSYYIIKPMNFSTNIKLRKKGINNFNIPKQKIDLLIEKLQIFINDSQLKQIFRFQDRIQIFRIRKQYRMYRPLYHTPSSDPMRFWKFVIQAHLDPIREKTKKNSGEWLINRRYNRLKYMKLWKTKLLNPKSNENDAELQELEEILSFEDIAYFRSLVEVSLPKESLISKELSSSWWEWGTSFLTSKHINEIKQFEEEDVKLSQIEKQQLHETLSNNMSKYNNEPENYIKSTIHISIEEIEFILKTITSNKSLLEGSIFGISFDNISRPTSSTTRVEIYSFKILDTYTKNTLYPIIAKPSSNKVEDFFSMIYEKNPISTNQDKHLEIDIKSCDIIIQPEYILRIIKILSSIPDKRSPIKLEKQISKKVQSITKISKITALHILDKHQNIFICINAILPKIYIIEDVTNTNSSTLCISLGNIEISSEISNLTKSIKLQRLQDHLYDRYQFNLHSTNIILYPNGINNIQSYCILKEFKIIFIIGLLLSPPTKELSKIKISGYCSTLSACINSKTINELIVLFGSLSNFTIPSISEEYYYNDNNDNMATSYDEMEKLLKNTKNDTPKIPPINSKMIEIHLSILKACLELQTSDEHIKPLMQISIHNFENQTIIKSLIIENILELQSIEIIDLQQQYNSKYNYILSSIDNSNILQEKPLLTIAFELYLDSKSSIYNDIDKLIIIDIQKLFFIFNRDTFVNLLCFLDEILLYQYIRGADVYPFSNSQMASKVDLIEFDSSDDEFYDAESGTIDLHINKEKPVIQSPKIDIKEPSNIISLQLILSISYIEILFNENRDYNSSLHMNSFNLGLNILNSKTILHTRLNNIKMKYYKKNIDIITTNQPLLNLEYILYSKNYSDYPGYKQKLQLHINTFNILLSSEFIIGFLLYFKEMNETYKQLSADNIKTFKKHEKQLKYHKQSISIEDKFNTLFLYNIHIESPKIIIPQYSNTNIFLILSLGIINIYNQQIQNNNILQEKLTLNIQSGSIYTIIKDIKNILLPDISLNIIYNNILRNDNNIPSKNILFKSNSIIFSINEESYIDIVNLSIQYIKEFTLRLKQLPKSKVKHNNNINNNSNKISKKSIPLLINIIIPKIIFKLENTDKDKPQIIVSIYNININFKNDNTDMQIYTLINNIKISESNREYKGIHSTLFELSKKNDKANIHILFKKNIKEIILSIVLLSPKIVIISELIYYLKDFFLSSKINTKLSKDLENDIMDKIPINNNKNSNIVVQKQNNQDNLILKNICLKINTLRIACIDNSSYGVVIQSNILMKYYTNEENKNINQIQIFIDNLQLNACQLHDIENTRSRILKPANLLIEISQSSKLLDINIIIEPIYITLSYRDIKLFMVIIKYIKPKDTKKTLEDIEKIEDVIFSPKKQNNILSTSKLNKGFENISITLGGTCLTFVDDIRGSNIPFVNFRIHGASSKIKDWSSKLDFLVKLKLQADYYNQFISNWEPLIEPHSSLFKLLRNKQQYKNNNFDNEENTCLELLSEDCLNINLTKAFMDILIQTTKAWSVDFGKHQSSIDYKREISTIILRNDTGIQISYFINAERSSKSLLEPGNEVILIKDEEVHSIDRGEEETTLIHAHTVSIYIDPNNNDCLWKPIEHLPLHRTGSWMLPLQNENNNNDNTIISRLEWNVKLKQRNQRVITMRSDVSVLNNCLIDLEFRVSYKPDNYDKTILIQNGESLSIPLIYSHLAIIYIKRPSDEYWSESIINLEKSSIYSEKTDNEYNNYLPYFHIKHDIYQKKETIIVSPPLIFENLLANTLYIELYNHNMENKPIQSLFLRKQEYLTNNEDNNNYLLRKELQRGEILEIYSIKDYKEADIIISLDNFNKSNKSEISLLPKQHIIITDKENRSLSISLNVSLTEYGHCICSFYVRYWLVNKTGLPILYRNYSTFSNNIAAGQSNNYNNNNSDIFSPLMYSYSNPRLLLKNKTCIKIGSSEWSLPISLESGGTNGCFSVTESNGSINYEIGVNISILSGRFLRTKLVSFVPRYILINNTNMNLYYRQIETNVGHLLCANSNHPFHWRDINKQLEICITYNEDYLWSPSFTISNISEFILQIPKRNIFNRKNIHYTNTINNNNNNNLLINTEIQFNDASFLIIFKEEKLKEPPYKIENSTNNIIYYYQKHLEDSKASIEPYSQQLYLFDYPDVINHYIVIEIKEYGYKYEFNFDQIKKETPITLSLNKEYQSDLSLKESITIIGEILIEGSTRILRLTDPYIHPLIELPVENDNTIFNENIFSFKLELSKGIGISMIDDYPQELLYITCYNIQSNIIINNKEIQIQASINDIQIDNQLSYATYPVLANRSPKILNIKPIFELSIIKSKYYKTISFFHYFSFSIQEMDILLDDIIINLIVEFFNLQKISQDPNFEDMNNLFNVIPKKTSQKIYLAFLHIHPCKFNLTFTFFSTNGDKRKKLLPTSSNVITKLSSAIGVTIANVDNAPISLNSLFLENVFAKRSEITRRIVKHYGRQALMGVYNIIGSFEIIGNPVSLVHNLGTGVYDFFYEPAKGIVHSPTEFLIGIKNGSTSLFKNSIVGIFGTTSNISRTIGKGVSQLTLDTEYIESRNIMSRETPLHIGQGLWLGSKELSYGLYGGLTGLIQQPIKSVQETGIKGFIRGTGKGVIGAIIKPTIGLIDFGTRTSQGIKNTAKLNEKIYYRIRPPRGFGPEKILMEYSLDKAIGHSILTSLFSTQDIKQWHLFHCISGNYQQILLVSNKYFLIIGVEKQDIIFRCKLTYIINNEIIVEGAKLSFYYQPGKNSWSFTENNPPAFFEIELFSHDTANWVKKRLQETLTLIKEFNQSENSITFTANSFSS